MGGRTCAGAPVTQGVRVLMHRQRNPNCSARCSAKGRPHETALRYRIIKAANYKLPNNSSERAYLLHFFTHALVASSRVISFIFSQSAFVVGAAGASSANAGALNASKRPATITVLRILADMSLHERMLRIAPQKNRHRHHPLTFQELSSR